MSLVHISELSKVDDNQMIMVIGWLENYHPHNNAVLRSPEKGSNSAVSVDLSGCDIAQLTQHGVFRVIGTFCRNNGLGMIKAHSLHSVSTWNYCTFSQLMQKQRAFISEHFQSG